MGRKSRRDKPEVPAEILAVKRLKTAAYVRISDEKDGDGSVNTQISIYCRKC